MFRKHLEIVAMKIVDIDFRLPRLRLVQALDFRRSQALCSGFGEL